MHGVQSKVGKIAAQLKEGKTAEELVKRARKRAKAHEVKQGSPKRLRLLSKKKPESSKVEQAMTGDEQMAIDLYEATQEKRRKVTLIDFGIEVELLLIFCTTLGSGRRKQ